jgi:hypothetical protein
VGVDLVKLRSAAKKRGPLVEIEEPEQPRYLGHAFPAEPEVVFPEDPAERARLSNHNAGVDCETFLIQPGRAVPRFVVAGYQDCDGTRTVVTQLDALNLDTGFHENLRQQKKSHTDFFLAFTDSLVQRWLKRQALIVAGDGATPTEGLLVNQNLPFDFAVIAEAAYQESPERGDAVMSRIFEMLDLEMGECVRLRERLIDLAEGTLGKNFKDLTKDGNPRPKRYNLKVFTSNYLGVDLDKLSFRLGYAALEGVSVKKYDEGEIGYVSDDTTAALQVGARQLIRAGIGRIPNAAEQTKAAFAFQLMSSWGIRTALSKVQQFDADLDKESRRFRRVVLEAGLVRATGRDAGSRDMKRVQALVAQAYEEANLPVPLTDGGKSGKKQVSTAGAVLEDIALLIVKARLRREGGEALIKEDGSVDETVLFDDPLYAYSQYVSIGKLQTTYLPVLYNGTRFPINAGFETILETGRTSWFQPNLTNLPRGGYKTLLQRLQARVRQCFVPRPGFVFCSVDYDTLELRTLAQVCLWLLGRSKLGEALNAGLDPHMMMAAEQFLKIPYEDAVKRKKDKDVDAMRQLSKVGNFGFPGGMGALALRDFAKATYNVLLTEEEARDLKAKYLQQWPEMPSYFKYVGQLMRGVNDYGQTIGDIEQFVSGRVRGRTKYTAACNTFFQGLAADGAKAACYALAKACYLRNGALFGSRSVAFIHDEVVMEHPEDVAAERAAIQAQIMCEEMQALVPDIKITAAPALMRCWYKEAAAVYKNGRLVCWEPEV